MFLLERPGNLQVIPQGNGFRIWIRDKNTYLHRFLLKAGPFKQVDHINGDPLDNRISNLRIISNTENTWNTRAHSDNKYSKYKGVSYWNYVSGRKKRWVTQFMANGKLYKKYHATEAAAAKYYNKLAKQHHGKFAVLNKVKRVKNFAKDLKKGHTGEERLQAILPTLIRTDGRKFDFTTSKGKSVELKFDSTRYARTNLFIETISNDIKKSPGGPFQSLANNVDYFVYLFNSGAIFCFYTQDLVDYVTNNKQKYDLKTVQNKYYNTLGYAIPIKDLEHLDLGLEVLK